MFWSLSAGFGTGSPATVAQDKFAVLQHALRVLSHLTFPCHLKQNVLLGPDKVIISTSLKVLLLNQRGQCSAALQSLELDDHLMVMLCAILQIAPHTWQ